MRCPAPVEPAQPTEVLGAAAGLPHRPALPAPSPARQPGGPWRSCQCRVIGLWPLYFCSAAQDQHFSHFQQGVTTSESFCQAFSWFKLSHTPFIFGLCPIHWPKTFLIAIFAITLFLPHWESAAAGGEKSKTVWRRDRRAGRGKSWKWEIGKSAK